MHRTRNIKIDSAKESGRSNDKHSAFDYREEKSKKGIRKQIEVVISKLLHEGFRTKLKRCVHIFLAVSIITSVILTLLETIGLPYVEFGKVPRNMVQLVGEDYSRIQFLSKMKVNWRRFQYDHNYQHVHVYTGGYEIFEEGNCKAMHPWQLQAYPNCNMLHEIDMSKPLHVGHGGFRDVWVMKEWDGTKLAVKTLVGKKKFTYREYDRHRRDAIAMSLLTSSKHIPNIYGYCTNSGLFDYSPNGSMEDHIFKSEKKQEWTKQLKLRFSWQAATGLADVHGVDMKGDSASISHTDISVDQFIWLDGMYKLNDFNRARFIRWDIVKNEPCTFFIGKNPGRYRSPEEYNYDYLTEKIDVYSLGNILYMILTKHQPFYNKNSTTVAELVKHGETPPIPNEIWGTEELAIIEAINMCWLKNPKDRSSARDVESFLRRKLLELNVAMF